MIRTPFYFFLHYKYEIFDQKNFSYIKKMNFKNLIFEEQSPHSRDFSHELGNVSF